MPISVAWTTDLVTRTGRGLSSRFRTSRRPLRSRGRSAVRKARSQPATGTGNITAAAPIFDDDADAVGGRPGSDRCGFRGFDPGALRPVFGPAAVRTLRGGHRPPADRPNIGSRARNRCGDRDPHAHARSSAARDGSDRRHGSESANDRFRGRANRRHEGRVAASRCSSASV